MWNNPIRLRWLKTSSKQHHKLLFGKDFAEMTEEKKIGFIHRMWHWWRRPSRFALGSLLCTGIIIGILGVAGFNKTLHHFNTNEFCISCHEMENNAYQEYTMSSHFINASGMQASCSDCHIPQEFLPMIERKIMASKEVFYHFTGKLDTPAKYNEHRKTMAINEWERMKANDSQECRNCHTADQMDLAAQKTVAANFHSMAEEDGKTCIDCHKGIAHQLPDMTGIDRGYF